MTAWENYTRKMGQMSGTRQSLFSLSLSRERSELSVLFPGSYPAYSSHTVMAESDPSSP